MQRHLIRGNSINNRGQSSISLNIVHPEPNNVTLTPIIIARGHLGLIRGSLSRLVGEGLSLPNALFL
jgi:hypothetical protein